MTETDVQTPLGRIVMYIIAARLWPISESRRSGRTKPALRSLFKGITENSTGSVYCDFGSDIRMYE